MRVLIAGGFVGAALVLLAGCSKPASTSGASSSSTVASAAPPASGPLTPQQIPHRKPGLWNQTMAMEGSGHPPMTTQLCIDADSESKMTVGAQNAPNAHCGVPQFTRNLDGSLSFTNSCDMGPDGRSQTTGKVTGDFNSSYTVAVDNILSGSPVAAMNGEHKMTITATWTGPCAPGQKGGDMIMPGGMKMNILDHMAGQPSGPPG